MRAALGLFEKFNALHRDFFVIAPTWDVLSAVVLHGCGYPAIATSSVSVGFANGVTSEETITRDEMLAVVAGICRRVEIPVSVDMESGYSDTAEGLEETTLALIEAGAVGLNIEDNSDKPGSPLVPADAHADRIRIIRRVAEKEGVPLFINGRTDGFWIRDEVPAEEKAKQAIARGNIYLKAGADGVFVSGPAIPASVIGPLASGLKGPLNLLMQPDWPPLAELRRLGVIRLTLGSWHTRAVVGFMQKVLQDLRNEERLDLLRQFAIPTPKVDALIGAARPAN
jgi:2-methylisocitrate lyase-like PEP mutase family enzyme